MRLAILWQGRPHKDIKEYSYFKGGVLCLSLENFYL
jgi:hypothetical protein